MAAQTSMGNTTATIGGHGEEPSSLRVASGRTPGMTGAGRLSGNATSTSQAKLSRTGAVVEVDLCSESVLHDAETSHARLPEPGSKSPRREGPKRSSEGMKAKAQYKAALKIKSRLQDKAALSQEEKERLAWAEQRIEEGRLHFASKPAMASTGGFANKVEEMLANKRQRSHESAAKDIPVSKRKRGPKEACPPPPKVARKAKVSDVGNRHLIVALIDRDDENGKISEARWKIVHARLVESLFARIEEAPTAPMPTFDGAGWFNGVKILKCNDDPTRKWLTQTVCQLEALWEGAKLEVVDRELIPSIPKAKVLFPIAIQGVRALKLLQRQNPDVPTANWKILHMDSPLPNEGGQSVVLQINKEAEDLLYPRFGKMAWGMGSVYLRLRKRHPDDKGAHILQAGEVEKDLGLEAVVDAAQDHAVDDSEEEEDGDLTVIANPSSGDKPATHDTEGAAGQSP
ncbi:uncharacterized protein LOC119554771 [Drosophila subpulchrella]|uniref:uncharacterized protein LOC119554771 n=1 Tax=Drosophila subpulchrella TaxID=1486046 RepID=UPI0018A18243|nr:uncharacterized protein LOC119554771 [Drosophila subpulchrella]